MITKRQEDILEKIIREYIKSAEPISSQLLERKYNLGLSPATIRAEMHHLEDEGFLLQPHASSGRVPTDTGYRFFVDELMEGGIGEKYFDLKFDSELDQSGKNVSYLMQLMTRNLSEISSNLVITYLIDEKIFWKDGWEELLEEPEFKENKIISEFSKLIRGFEKNIDNLKVNSEIEICIGGENPFFKAKEFTIIYSRCILPQKKEGIISILGPKRMKYEKNIGLINSIRKLFSF